MNNLIENIPMMRNSKLLAKALLVFAFGLFITADSVLGGVTGKISGVVEDSETLEPIVGATVRIVGLNIATQTDVDGEYFIINVPSGKYDIAITSVGYETVIKKEVRVLVDLTTPVDFELKQGTVNLGVDFVVSAEKPVIQKDITSSRIIFTADRLEGLPNNVTVKNVLTNYPGVIVGKDENLHVRGGRSGQLAYYYDGFLVEDPFVKNSGIHIIPTSLEELTLTSSGYTAEYGEALSGVVSAVTKDGGKEYHGSVRAYQGFTHRYDVTKAGWSDLSKIDNYSGAFQLSGPIPNWMKGSNTFSMAGEYINDPGSLPHNTSEIYAGTMKLSLQPISKLRLVSNMSYYSENGDIYDHRDPNNRSYDFNLDGLPVYKKESYLVGLSGNYHLNENTIISSRLNRYYTNTKVAPEHLFDLYWNEWPGYSEDSNGVYNGTIDDDNYLNTPNYTDPLNVTRFTTGDDFDPTYQYRKSEYNAFSLSLVNQYNKHNQIKTGFEYRYYDISWDKKQFYNDQPYGEKFSSTPTYFSTFIQDKMEYDKFIVNVGLRYEYRNDNVKYNSTPLDSIDAYKEAEPFNKISPRFGISFPIDERTMIRMNYGVYYQVAQFTYMYTNLDGNIESGLPLLGNPNLQPERTTAYEIGLDHMLNSNLRLNVTAYYKDIDDLITTISTYRFGKGSIVTSFENGDYGSVKGLDFAIEKIKSDDIYSASVSYSYMVSKGNSSYALEPYYTFATSPTDTIAPVTAYPLDFDQRHTVTGVFNVSLPSNFKGKMFGLQVPTNWSLTAVGRYGSGLPYTRTKVDGGQLGERNAVRLPATYSVDMKFNKSFNLSNNKMLRFFIEVDNLFNRKNILNVYSLTGRPDYDNSTPVATLSLSQNDIDYYDRLFDSDPQNYSSPRTVRSGLEFHF